MAHAIYTSFNRLVDSNGVPLEDARVFVLTAGSSTLKTIYSNEALSTPATNPITLTAGGPHSIRYVAAGTYKIQVETGGTDTLGSGTTVSEYSKDNIDTGVAVGSGALPVASGGTGSSTEAGARTNLGAASSSEVATISADLTSHLTTHNGTDATQIATGTTAQAATSGAGKIRSDTDLDRLRWHNGTAYRSVWTHGDITDAEMRAELPPGSVIDFAFASYASDASLTTAIPSDGTIPLVGEGTEILSASITPKTTTNKIRFRFCGFGGINTTADFSAAAFVNGGTCVQAVQQSSAAGAHPLSMEWVYTPGATSAQTISIRVGPSSGTLKMNAAAGANNRFGGACAATLTIEEIVAV
jgi:hypothetical protein